MAFDDRFQYIIDNFGTPVGEPMSDSELDAYKGRLPETLIEFWRQFGTGVILNGHFQFSKPSMYAPIAKLLLQGDAEIEPDKTHIVGFSAFGKIVAWNEKLQDMRIDLVNLRLSCANLTRKSQPVGDDVAIASNLMGADDEALGEYDSAGNPIFNRARKALGAVKQNQIYGFYPLLAFGGSRSVESLRISSAPEHMAIMAQAGALNLWDYSTLPGQLVRPIGG